MALNLALSLLAVFVVISSLVLTAGYSAMLVRGYNKVRRAVTQTFRPSRDEKRRIRTQAKQSNPEDNPETVSRSALQSVSFTQALGHQEPNEA